MYLPLLPPRFWFNLGMVALGVEVIIMIYLTIYLPYIARIHLEWSVYCPRVIPAGAVFGVIMTIR